MRRLDDLRRWLKETVKVAEESLKLIDERGLSGNYSCNHDILKWAERAHRASYELWLLGDIEREIEIAMPIPVDVEWEEGEETDD
tara:strand:- start:12 stop:266 length:255 start_codon:yes stop_codon:yes gene_type:complete